MKQIVFFIGCILLSCNMQSNKTVSAAPAETTDCEHPIIINLQKYQSNSTDEFKLLNAKILDQCLKVKIQYDGGCGEVVLDLFDSGEVVESLPVQRNLKLIFKDNDNCEALVTKDFSFNLMSLKAESNQKILLNLDQWPEQLMY